MLHTLSLTWPSVLLAILATEASIGEQMVSNASTQ